MANAQAKPAWEEYDRLLESRQAIAALSADNVFGDNLDLYSGVLSFSATDISIPGNSALPVAVTRKFTVTNREKYSGYAYSFADWELDIPRLSGVFAETWHDSRCDIAAPPPAIGGVIPADEFWAGNHAEMPGGGEMLRVATTWPQPSTGGPYKWVTAGNTYFSCLASIDNGSGQGFLAIASDGTKYWFNHMARVDEPGFQYHSGGSYNPWTRRYKVYLYATRVEDRFGNWVTYSYSNTATQPVRITQITSNDSRTITFQYNTSGFVSSVRDGSRTWTYGYQGDSLSSVTLPDTSSWQISFASLSDARITPSSGDPRTCFSLETAISGDFTGSITHPSGATGTYTVGPARFGRSNVPAVCRNYQSPGVPDPSGKNDDYFVLPVRALALTLKSRRISGPGLATGTWTYAWSGGMGSWQYPPGETEPVCRDINCLDPVCLSDDCAGARSIAITDPDGNWTRHVYGTSYRYNEGKLLSVQRGKGSDVLRTVAYDHNYAISGQSYSAKIGSSPQQRGAGFVSEYPRPNVARITTQDATDFIWVVAKGCPPAGAGIYCFDQFARPTKVIKASMAAGTTDLVPPGDIPVLSVPATSNTGNYSVTWSAVAYATRYELRERLGSAAWSTIHNAAGRAKPLSGKANGNWSYQVRACNAQGCAGWSAVVTIAVAVPPSTAPVITAPATSSSGNYSIAWTTVSRATRYEVHERKDGGTWTIIHNGTSTSQNITLRPSGSYEYRARACNTGGCSGYSAIATTVVTITTPPPPAPTTLNVPPTVEQMISFTVSWSSVSGATGYELEQSRDGGAWTTPYSGAATSTTRTLGMPGTYRYRVQACNTNGCGAYSVIKSAYLERDTSLLSVEEPQIEDAQPKPAGEEAP